MLHNPLKKGVLIHNCASHALKAEPRRKRPGAWTDVMSAVGGGDGDIMIIIIGIDIGPTSLALPSANKSALLEEGERKMDGRTWRSGFLAVAGLFKRMSSAGRRESGANRDGTGAAP